MSKKIWIIGTVVLLAVGFLIFKSAGFLSAPSKGGSEVQAPADSGPAIVVNSPANGELVRPGTPLVVRGKARVFENQFSIRLLGGGRKIYESSASTDAKEAGVFGNFSVSIPISKKDVYGISNLILEIFDHSAKDGSEIDRVSVNLLVGA